MSGSKSLAQEGTGVWKDCKKLVTDKGNYQKSYTYIEDNGCWVSHCGSELQYGKRENQNDSYGVRLEF